MKELIVCNLTSLITDEQNSISIYDWCRNSKVMYLYNRIMLRLRKMSLSTGTFYVETENSEGCHLGVPPHWRMADQFWIAELVVKIVHSWALLDDCGDAGINIYWQMIVSDLWLPWRYRESNFCEVFRVDTKVIERIQYVSFDLAVWKPSLIYPIVPCLSWQLNPVSTYYSTVNHETKSKKNIAFVGQKTSLANAIYVDSLL